MYPPQIATVLKLAFLEFLCILCNILIKNQPKSDEWNTVKFGVFNSLHWRHNDHDGVSNHQPHGCLLNRLFRRRSKKTSKLRVTGLRAGNSPGPVNSSHKGPDTQKMFPFDDVIMYAIFQICKPSYRPYQLILKVIIPLKLTFDGYFKCCLKYTYA